MTSLYFDDDGKELFNKFDEYIWFKNIKKITYKMISFTFSLIEHEHFILFAFSGIGENMKIKISFKIEISHVKRTLILIFSYFFVCKVLNEHVKWKVIKIKKSSKWNHSTNYPSIIMIDLNKLIAQREIHLSSTPKSYVNL